MPQHRSSVFHTFAQEKASSAQMGGMSKRVNREATCLAGGFAPGDPRWICGQSLETGVSKSSKRAEKQLGGYYRVIMVIECVTTV